MAVKMNSPLFSINNFVFQYPDTKTPSVDFTKSNLVIPRGKKTFILGPSGCGKSTLLQILGLLRDAPLSTSMITMDGTQDYSKLSSNDKTAIRGKNFGFILQSFYLLPNFRVLENIAMPLILNGMHRRDMITHDIQTAIRHADYFVVMDSNHHLAMAFPKEEYQKNKGQLIKIMDLEYTNA